MKLYFLHYWIYKYLIQEQSSYFFDQIFLHTFRYEYIICYEMFTQYHFHFTCSIESETSKKIVNQKKLHISSQLIQRKYKKRSLKRISKLEKKSSVCFPACEYFALYSRKETYLGKLLGLRSVKYFAWKIEC